MVQQTIARETAETTVMMLSWNRDSRPTTSPVSTMPVRSVSFQKIRSTTGEEEKVRENIFKQQQQSQRDRCKNPK